MGTGNMYVGIDLHKRSFSFVILDVSGHRLSQGSCSTEKSEVHSFASSLDSRCHVAFEPLGNGYWFKDQLQPYVGSIHLANPYKVRLIAESRLKNDQIDACILADLLRVGYLPEVYIPTDQVISWRRLISHRIHLVQDRTRCRNRILDMISREGLRVKVGDAFGKSGRAEMDKLSLSEQSRSFVDDMLVRHDLIDKQIGSIDKEIQAISETDPVCCLLQTIDGVGSFTALSVRAIVGEMSRFRSAKAFAAYTGLIPGYRHSAEKVHNGPITKQGSPILRWVLLQGVNHFKRNTDYLQRLYSRICFRSSTVKARVAVAHAMARIIYHVWMEARPYYRSQVEMG